MSQSVISDNWALQDISELLVNGMDDNEGNYVAIDRANDSYEYKDISRRNRCQRPIVSNIREYCSLTPFIPRTPLISLELPDN